MAKSPWLHSESVIGTLCALYRCHSVIGFLHNLFWRHKFQATQSLSIQNCYFNSRLLQNRELECHLCSKSKLLGVPIAGLIFFAPGFSPQSLLDIYNLMSQSPNCEYYFTAISTLYKALICDGDICNLLMCRRRYSFFLELTFL